MSEASDGGVVRLVRAQTFSTSLRTAGQESDSFYSRWVQGTHLNFTDANSSGR
jgi:hypothetical protein